MPQLRAKTTISVNADGVMHFDSDAVKEFRRREIEFVAFKDQCSGRTALRSLVASEKKELEITKADFFAEIRCSDSETPLEYLRFVGIKMRKGKKYQASLNDQGNGIIVSVL
jgi:hypothetical protein